MLANNNLNIIDMIQKTKIQSYECILSTGPMCYMADAEISLISTAIRPTLLT